MSKTEQSAAYIARRDENRRKTDPANREKSLYKKKVQAPTRIAIQPDPVGERQEDGSAITLDLTGRLPAKPKKPPFTS